MMKMQLVLVSLIASVAMWLEPPVKLLAGERRRKGARGRSLRRQRCYRVGRR